MLLSASDDCLMEETYSGLSAAGLIFIVCIYSCSFDIIFFIFAVITFVY
jgi:hypothetical protein